MLKKQFMLKSNSIIVEVPTEHVFECFVKEVKKDIQPEPDPFSKVIGCRRESDKRTQLCCLLERQKSILI